MQLITNTQSIERDRNRDIEILPPPSPPPPLPRRSAGAVGNRRVRLREESVFQLFVGGNVRD
jgi:hypothetical protein